ncbi:MAG TPA: autotransporter-associated beta strand repeat-containing protein, partial [Verrucomicrobiae bacterium]|nr:autotransporter-associated beta strand repeat-containing protein [Verrucomicrobiae bacterium]
MKLLFWFPALLWAATTPFASAGSATWSAHPVSSDWTTAANWIPATVPDGPDDVATFSTSDITAVTLHSSVEVNAIVFAPGASPFTINPTERSITFIGGGVINNSEITQNFVIDTATTGFLYFKGSATAGDLVQYTQSGGLPFSGQNAISFYDNSTAGTATFNVNGGPDSGNQFGGILTFWGEASADNATIIANGGGPGTNGGIVYFNGTSTASHASIFANGATARNGSGGFVSFQFVAATADQAVITAWGSDVGGAGNISFQDAASAANATLMANPGEAYGGQIVFSSIGAPTGGSAPIKLVGNGKLYDLLDSYLEIGSLEGDGFVSLGTLTGANLSIGTNNLSTVFSGLIEERSGSTKSALTKIGTGSLTLNGANTYAVGTTIEAGELVLNNRTGSGTGTGAVQVNAGRLAGRGIIAGAVVVGTGTGSGAMLAPGQSKARQNTLTVQGALT